MNNGACIVTKYFIQEINDFEQHAGTKAREDVVSILTSIGWQPLQVRKCFGGGMVDKFKAIPDVYWDWHKLVSKLHSGDVLLIQFPINTYLGVSKAALPSIRAMKKHGVKIILLIHDLDSLRNEREVESAFLPLADVSISHNSGMTTYIKDNYHVDNVVELGVFDYLAAEPPEHSERAGIDVAGNLEPTKSSYVYKLHAAFPNAAFNLYGPNFVKQSDESKWYGGSFPPGDLTNILTGKFGLVWDGDSIDTCSGKTGTYLRYNNPHKLSLYLAAAEPVIIWREAAEAAFVEANGVGLTVSDLHEAVSRMQSLSSEEYERMLESAKSISNLLRSGHYLREAIATAETLL